jgi:two-component system CheB/CheR fusion protein
MVANNTAATHLYRIAQEAVNNALRHSRADQIRISFLQGTDGIVLEVCDNGIGFDPAVMNRTASLGTTHGFGLRILNYRAGMIGGTLRITRGAEGGMLVKCTLPRENTLQ